MFDDNDVSCPAAVAICVAPPPDAAKLPQSDVAYAAPPPLYPPVFENVPEIGLGAAVPLPPT